MYNEALTVTYAYLWFVCAGVSAGVCCCVCVRVSYIFKLASELTRGPGKGRPLNASTLRPFARLQVGACARVCASVKAWV